MAGGYLLADLAQESSVKTIPVLELACWELRYEQRKLPTMYCRQAYRQELLVAQISSHL